VPLPLSAILALCIDLGADLWPAITFAYEYPETDIMERPPRNPKRDFLVSKKMFVSSYVLIGPTEAFAAFLAYFMVMNDYGFRPGTLLGLGTEKGYYPNDNDVYDPNLPNMGNTNFGNPDFYSLLDWTSPADGHVDARLFFASRGANAWSACRWIEGSAHPGLHWYRNSRVTSHQICYTSESVHYANSAYLTTVICCQWANCLINKSRVMSLGQQGFKSMHVNSGFVYSFCLMILIQYLPFINIAFASRSIAFPHFFVAGFPWFLWILLFDEMRKLYVRQGLKRMPGGIMLYDTWFA
jgi:sodium/potassium-transporting ATPase subunit alpha